METRINECIKAICQKPSLKSSYQQEKDSCDFKIYDRIIYSNSEKVIKKGRIHLQETTKKDLIDWAKAIIFAIILAFLLRSFIFATSIVEGSSMYPTLKDGERVVFNKILYHVDEPNRGEIIIIQRPDKNYVKRVIGLPSDTVQVKNHTLYINGKEQTQTYLKSNAINGTRDFGPVQVPKDDYFVMGDNRSISMDSRNGLGFIKRDEIIGRSELVVFPFDQFGLTR